MVTYIVIGTYIQNLTFLALVVSALCWYVSQSVSQLFSFSFYTYRFLNEIKFWIITAWQLIMDFELKVEVLSQPFRMFIVVYIYGGGKEWLGFSDLWFSQKPWWNWYLTPVENFGQIRRAQLAKFTLLTSTLVPLDLFWSFKVCSDDKERVGCGKQREATAPIQPY